MSNLSKNSQDMSARFLTNPNCFNQEQLSKLGIEDDQIQLDVKYFCDDKNKILLFMIMSVMTCGILPVICVYVPTLKIKFRKSLCEPIHSDYIITYVEGIEVGADVEHFSLGGNSVIFVELKCKRYFSAEFKEWKLIQIAETPKNFYEKFISPNKTVLENQAFKDFYGKNVMKLPAADFFDILFEQFLSPFFVFQYFSFIVWMLEEYYLFSFIILFITLFSIYLNTNERIFNLRRYH